MILPPNPPGSGIVTGYDAAGYRTITWIEETTGQARNSGYLLGLLAAALGTIAAVYPDHLLRNPAYALRDPPWLVPAIHSGLALCFALPALAAAAFAVRYFRGPIQVRVTFMGSRLAIETGLEAMFPMPDVAKGPRRLWRALRGGAREEFARDEVRSISLDQKGGDSTHVRIYLPEGRRHWRLGSGEERQWLVAVIEEWRRCG